MSPKNPLTPPAPLSRTDADVVEYLRPLWRIHRVSGSHQSEWDELREHGPIRSMRWDPHPAPEGEHPGIGVSYASADLGTVVAETFHDRRVVTLSSGQALVGWAPIRPLRLLHLTGPWAIANGASASLHSAHKNICRAWARAIHEQWPDLDGLLVPSTMTGELMVVLFSPAATSFPAAPMLSAQLHTRVASDLIHPHAQKFGWDVRRV